MKTPATVYESKVGSTLTERGRKAVNRATAILAGSAATIGAVAFVEAASSTADSYTKPSNRELAANTRLLDGARQADDFTGQITLSSGVKLRLSPAFINGDNSTGEHSNIAIDLNTPISVNNAIVAENGWVAFDRPTDDPQIGKSRKDMAKAMVYVNVPSLQQLSPDSIIVSDAGFNDSFVDNEGKVQSSDLRDGPDAQIIASHYIEPSQEG
jgi:hypothetical protein